MQTDLKYDDPAAQTVFEGREYEARIRFLVPIDATEDQIAEGLEWELGGGSIDNDHPFVNADFRQVSVSDVRATGYQKFTDWNEASDGGRRTGRGRTELVSR